jgi:predicted DNA-binding transcriptional regulator AlpA
MTRIIISAREVERRTGFCRRTILSRRQAGKFPQPVDMGDGDHPKLGYFEDEIEAYIESRPRVGILPQPNMEPQAA